jgi:phosphoribosylformimino-5-aminoimidazole carboxamide ribotide isomerase
VSARKSPRFCVIPAIDLRAGHVVRLTEGDFNREQVYSEDPSAVAREFGAAGAEWVHVVDLDGARAGKRLQTESIRRIRHALPAATRLQVGGGMRSEEALVETLAAGADRVVLGTVALEDPDLLKTLVGQHGSERVAVALDVRDGLAVGHGWVQGAAGQPVEVAIDRLGAAEIRTFVVTAIDRDGLLGGPDLRLLERLIGLTDAAVIASGGIAGVEDLEATRRIGCSGAIVGRALYDGRFDLAGALAALR